MIEATCRAGVAGARELPDLVPVRMVNEFCYCPRLAYLEWVQGEFADSLDTLEGRFAHWRVDKGTGTRCRRPGAVGSGQERGGEWEGVDDGGLRIQDEGSEHSTSASAVE